MLIPLYFLCSHSLLFLLYKGILPALFQLSGTDAAFIHMLDKSCTGSVSKPQSEKKKRNECRLNIKESKQNERNQLSCFDHTEKNKWIKSHIKYTKEEWVDVEEGEK